MKALISRLSRWVLVGSLALSAGVTSGGLVSVQGCARSANPTAPVEGDADWNDSGINWRPYEAGLAEARAAGKPIVLVFYTDWCPHCHNYSRVFHDPEVARLAASFVMIRVERDGHRDISARYALDGEYIPRTFFLSPEGVLLPGLDSGREQYRYYLDEHDPSELTSRMEEALERAGG
jgi:thiol-disulfide isomerase/thioredoxin